MDEIERIKRLRRGLNGKFNELFKFPTEISIVFEPSGLHDIDDSDKECLKYLNAFINTNHITWETLMDKCKDI